MVFNIYLDNVVGGKDSAGLPTVAVRANGVLHLNIRSNNYHYRND